MNTLTKKLEKGYFATLVTTTLMIVGIPVAFAWTSAPANPPKNNVEAPVNVSISNQNKLGKLGLGGLAVFGKFQLIDGTEGVGKVLVSDSSGKASWGTPLAGGGVAVSAGSSGQILAGWPNAITCNSTTGIKKVLRLDGYYPQGRERYSSRPGYIYGEIGSIMSIYFDEDTKKSLIVHGNGDYGGNLPGAFAGCFDLGKSISDPIFTSN